MIPFHLSDPAGIMTGPSCRFRPLLVPQPVGRQSPRVPLGVHRVAAVMFDAHPRGNPK